jgi:hypothetical protein
MASWLNFGAACKKQYRHVSGVCVSNRTGFLDLMITFIGPSLNWLQQFTNHYQIHCHLLPIGHSTETILTSKWILRYSVVLPQFWSPTLFCTTYKSSARTPRKTPSHFVKNACLLARYLAMDGLLLRAYALGMCLPSRCLAMSICVTICSLISDTTHKLSDASHLSFYGILLFNILFASHPLTIRETHTSKYSRGRLNKLQYFTPEYNTSRNSMCVPQWRDLK